MIKVLLATLFFLFVTESYAQKVEVRPQIGNLADKMRQDNMVHFGYPVGFAGKPETNNKYYKSYLKLKEKATNDELVLLTRDRSECIVVYSFAILQSRNYHKLKDIFLQHSSDTAFFWTAGGCTGVLDRVNWFMLKQLKPKNDVLNKNCLSKEEFDRYCFKFKKDDSLFSSN